jgi:hypothetical protein
MQYGQVAVLGGRSDQQIRHPSSLFASTREHALHLTSPRDVTCLYFNQIKGTQCRF